MSGRRACLMECGGEVDFLFPVLTIEFRNPCRHVQACACEKCGRVYHFLGYSKVIVKDEDGSDLEVFSINREYVSMNPAQVEEHMSKFRT